MRTNTDAALSFVFFVFPNVQNQDLFTIKSMAVLVQSVEQSSMESEQYDWHHSREMTLQWILRHHSKAVEVKDNNPSEGVIIAGA